MRRLETLSDAHLVRKALLGQRRAGSDLARRLLPTVAARCARRMGRRHSDFQDMIQEVWLALFEQGGRRLLAFRPEQGASLEAFVGRIAERRVLDEIRKRGAHRRGGHLLEVSLPLNDDSSLQLASENSRPEEEVAAEDMLDKLDDHLSATLPERGFMVFEFVFRKGLSPAEAAKKIGVKTQVVYNWEHKIRNLALRFLVHHDAFP